VRHLRRMGSSQELSAQASYDAFWPRVTEEIRTMDLLGLKHQELPLARIKKVKINPIDLVNTTWSNASGWIFADHEAGRRRKDDIGRGSGLVC
jgi:hypothetical protein